MARHVVFGSGGHGREAVGALQRLIANGPGHTIALATDNPGEAECMGYPVLRLEQLLPEDRVVIAIGSSVIRRDIEARLADRGIMVSTLIARTAIVARDSTLGPGALVSDYAIVTANAQIGRQFQCNMFSLVAHDCVIGDYVTFATRVTCNGNVHIGDDVYVGSGAVIRNGSHENPLRIGAGAVVGMGAVVVTDVPPGTTVVGNPARSIIH